MTYPGIAVNVLSPAVFHFAVPGKPCSYWTNGNHIVADGVCRCGMKFLLAEEIAK
jgi:hypothetical protein